MADALDQKGLAEAALTYKRQHRNTCLPNFGVRYPLAPAKTTQEKDHDLATLRARVEELEREVERAFRDGIAYATVCDVTDVDLAWQSSAALDRLTNIMGDSDG